MTSAVPIVVKLQLHRALIPGWRHLRREAGEVRIASDRLHPLGAHHRSFPALNDGSLLGGSVVVVSAAAAATIGVAGAGESDGVAAVSMSSAWRNAIRAARHVGGSAGPCE